MTLRELIGAEAPETEISGLALSSRDAGPGTLFFSCPASPPTAMTSPRMR